MGINGKNNNGETVTINLKRWQLVFSIGLALILSVNALITMVDTIWGEETPHYVENGEKLQSVIKEAISEQEILNSKDREEIRSDHAKDINALDQRLARMELRINTRFDQVIALIQDTHYRSKP